MNIYCRSFKTSIGTLRCAATEKGLALLTLPGETEGDFNRRLEKLFPDADVINGGSVTKQTEKQINAYLAGRLKKFTLPLEIHATPFHKDVLKQVAKIPYGETRTYGQIARAIGRPGASRAVGTANARNNIPIVIPCHRVVAANDLGGYGGGVELKRKLLQLEGVLLSL